jgi:hypothetical protein
MKHFEQMHTVMTGRTNSVNGSMRSECEFKGSDRISQNRSASREGLDG